MLKFFVGFLVVSVVLLILTLIIGIYKRSVLRRYRFIEIGMEEDEMLSIMGGRYNRSSLKNNVYKYEWRINATSYGSYGNGFSSRSYSGVRKVDIYVKDGRVFEIRPHNV